MLAALINEKWAGVRAGLLTVVDGFSAADLAYRPFSNAYSVAELILHVAHEEDIEVGWGLSGRLPDMPPTYGAADFNTGEAIRAVLDASHSPTVAYIETLSDAELEAEFETPWGQRQRRIDLLWHTLEHEVHHRGELSLVLGLLGRSGLDA
jgi:uncharacterized damage-inducible protein DinB